MLFNTFIHLDGITEKSEILLYKNGIYNWDDFLKAKKIDFIPNDKLELIKAELKESYKRFAERDINYFLRKLSKNNSWRVYKEFKKWSCFLDIETDGKGGMDSEITIIGLFSDSGYKCYINGDNLDRFEDDILKYDLVITFNGRLFDFPVLMKYFRTRYFNHIAHIDMRYICSSLDSKFRGGLKSIEKKIGLYRPPSIRDLNGYDAVKLWERYCAGEKECLDLLIEYNRYDVMNLSKLSDFMYQYGVNLMKEKGLILNEEGKDE